MEKKYDVFISCKSEDYGYAEEVYNFLNSNGIHTFLASKELRKMGDSEYRNAIMQALDSAYHLIIFASKPEYVESKWVFYEWDTFVNAKLNGRKDGQIMTILKGFNISKLRLDLIKYESFAYGNYKERILPYVETPESQRVKELQKQQEDTFRQQAAIEAQRRIKEEKQARIREEEYKKALAEAQRKEEERIRKEAEEMARKEKEAKALEEKKKQSIAKVHLCVDADSRVYYSNKEIARCSAHEEVIVDLPFGEHTLKIVSVEDNSVKKQLSVNVNSSNLAVDEIKIAPIIKRKKTIARKKKEEEERKEWKEQYKREQIVINVQEEKKYPQNIVKTEGEKLNPDYMISYVKEKIGYDSNNSSVSNSRKLDYLLCRLTQCPYAVVTFSIITAIGYVFNKFSNDGNEFWLYVAVIWWIIEWWFIIFGILLEESESKFWRFILVTSQVCILYFCG